MVLSGQMANSAPMRTIGDGILDAPLDVTVLPDGMLAVADARGIVVLDAAGVALGRAGFGEDRVMIPRGVDSRDGRLYVSDGDSSRILVYELAVTER